MDTALRIINAYLHGKSVYRNNLYLEVSAVFPLTLNEDYHPAKNANEWQPVAALKRRINQIGTRHILFGTDWPLIDIVPYREILNEQLGTGIVQRIINHNIRKVKR